MGAVALNAPKKNAKRKTNKIRKTKKPWKHSASKALFLLVTQLFLEFMHLPTQNRTIDFAHILLGKQIRFITLAVYLTISYTILFIFFVFYARIFLTHCSKNRGNFTINNPRKGCTKLFQTTFS